MELLIRHRKGELSYTLLRRAKRALIFDQEVDLVSMKKYADKINSAAFSELHNLLMYHSEHISTKIIPRQLLEIIFESAEDELRLDIDLDLDFFPWELLCFEKKFLGLTLPLGRVHRIDRFTSPFNIDDSCKICVVAESYPNLSLAAADLEKNLRVMNFNTSLIIEKNEFVLQNSHSVEALHFIGHETKDLKFKSSIYDRGPFKAQIVWIDSCKSIAPQNYLEIMERFNARHVIGNIGLVPEERPHQDMGIIPQNFYRLLNRGLPIGHALFEAKKIAFDKGQPDWAWISLWGEPDYRYRNNGIKTNKIVTIAEELP